MTADVNFGGCKCRPRQSNRMPCTYTEGGTLHEMHENHRKLTRCLNGTKKLEKNGGGIPITVRWAPFFLPPGIVQGAATADDWRSNSPRMQQTSCLQTLRFCVVGSRLKSAQAQYCASRHQTPCLLPAQDSTKHLVMIAVAHPAKSMLSPFPSILHLQYLPRTSVLPIHSSRTCASWEGRQKLASKPLFNEHR